MTREHAVRAEDIERYRRVLTELRGEASIEQLAEHAGHRRGRPRLHRGVPDRAGLGTG